MKVFCRILTLLAYIIGLFGIMVLSLDILDLAAVNDIDIRIWIVSFAVLLLIAMAILLIIKFVYRDKSKVNIYRFIDMLFRYIIVLPITFVIQYLVVISYFDDEIIKIVIGVILFAVLNLLLRFGVQETLDVTFMGDDSL